jgi:hypothetical protein
MYIVFQGGYEVLVTTSENEAKFIQLYFNEGGRDLDDYDRLEVSGPGVCLTPSIQID